jgi:hypothetical protein
MEMMNIDAAIRMLDNHKIKLEGTRKIVLETIGKTYADSDVAASVNSIREDFKKQFRSALVDSIILNRRMSEQVSVLLNFPAELARLRHSEAAFFVEIKETEKALLQIDPTYSDPKQDKSTEATSDLTSTQR